MTLPSSQLVTVSRVAARECLAPQELLEELARMGIKPALELNETQYFNPEDVRKAASRIWQRRSNSQPNPRS